MSRPMDGLDLPCDEVRDGLSAMLDGAADTTEKAAVLRHIEHCPGCAAYGRDLWELDAGMRGHLDNAFDDQALWRRVRDRIAIANQWDSDGRRQATASRRTLLNRRAAAAVILGLGLAAAAVVFRPSESVSILAEVRRDFAAYRNAGDVLDVSAEHPAAIRLWMSARVEFPLPKSIAGTGDVLLVGGRLCSILGRKLAFLSYRSAADDVALYVTPAKGLDLPAENALSAIAGDDGLSTVMWQRGELAYVAVSNMALGRLAEFVDSFLGRNDEVS